ncbi:MAG: hypothetical protein IKP76_01035 [Bacilli bacterium]|nr:hypothetical protein [Bacilli bacterium]
MKNKYLKLFVIIMALFMLSGCVHVNRDSYDTIANNIIDSNVYIYNHYDRGYKHYIPRGLSVKQSNAYNEIIKSNKYEYYLYVDLVSYFNKIEFEYKTNENAYYSSLIKDGKGLIEITQKDDNYLVVVQYNYAKVETLVKERDIKLAVSNSLIMLSTINYNNEVIQAMLDEGVLSLNERKVDVFNNDGKVNQNELQEIDEDNYRSDEEKEKDRDYIN